jgi:endo-1,4-beta-xylanase
MKNDSLRAVAVVGMAAALFGCSTRTSGATSPGSGGGAATGGVGGRSTGGGGPGGATSTGGATVVTKYIGNISSKNQDIQADFADKWMQVTMEANSKWGFVQPDSPDRWVWEPVDQVYQYAIDHDIGFKGHTFFWATEQPRWVNDSNVLVTAEAWVKAFCERYPRTAMIDVVNEPGHNPAPYRNGMGGAGSSGFDWVVTGFKWARKHCPGAVLILNEFNIIEYDNDNDAYISMLQKVLAAGAPVDAIGAQGHDVYKIGVAKAKGYLDKLASTFHLPIYITEMDIDQADDAQQKQSMQDSITMFWNHPAIKGITYWGYVKGTTWRGDAWLMDTSGKYRPSMTWLQDFIKMNR